MRNSALFLVLLCGALAARAQDTPAPQPPVTTQDEATTEADPAPDAEAAAGPAATVARLQDGLIALMQSTDTGDARTDAIVKLLRDTHDLPYIARVALGRHWRALSAEEQAAFLERFEALSVATFAARFRRYAGERFDAPRDETQPGGETVVRSTLTGADGTPHEFEYLLRQDGQRWLIVNIIVDGVSDLALKRAEYDRLMDAGGFPALAAELDRQIERLRAEAAAPA
jgi:phospholipid transport system substrate-binding protein